MYHISSNMTIYHLICIIYNHIIYHRSYTIYHIHIIWVGPRPTIKVRAMANYVYIYIYITTTTTNNNNN